MLRQNMRFQFTTILIKSCSKQFYICTCSALLYCKMEKHCSKIPSRCPKYDSLMCELYSTDYAYFSRSGLYIEVTNKNCVHKLLHYLA